MILKWPSGNWLDEGCVALSGLFTARCRSVLRDVYNFRCRFVPRAVYSCDSHWQICLTHLKLQLRIFRVIKGKLVFILLATALTGPSFCGRRIFHPRGRFVFETRLTACHPYKNAHYNANEYPFMRHLTVFPDPLMHPVLYISGLVMSFGKTSQDQTRLIYMTTPPTKRGGGL